MKGKKQWAIAAILLLLGGGLLLAGVAMGGYDSTYIKGIYICLECIGIG